MAEYDAVKAHKYYMEHRKLNGRKKRRTGLQASFAKKLRENRKQALKELREYFKAQREKLQAILESQKAMGLNRYVMADLRQANMAMRKQLSEKIKQQRAQIRLDTQKKIDAI